MTAVAADVLLALGAAAQVLCAIGVLVARGPYGKLHYVGGGTTVGPLLVGTGVFLHFGWTASGLQTIATIALLVLPVPATTMALARAARRIDRSSVAPRPEEAAR